MEAITQSELPLDGILVIDFSQFLGGPAASLRLLDLGARVIKIEQPGIGDISRKKLVLGNQYYEEDSVCFHVINRGKESYAANLKDPNDLAKVKELLSKSDVVMHNFRPGVMEQFGLDYETLSKTHPHLIYGWINGYGTSEKFRERPGVDTLAQSMSGLGTSSGPKMNPTLVGVAVTDISSSTQLALGITSLLYQKARTGKGGYVQTSLVEAALDLQFDFLANYIYRGDKELPRSNSKASLHAYLSAPAGIYKTKNSFITLAMYPVDKLFTLLKLDPAPYLNPDSWWEERDEILDILTKVFRKKTTEQWLKILDKEDVWCAPIYTHQDLIESGLLESLDYLHKIEENEIVTARSPITINHKTLFNGKRAPHIGEQNQTIDKEFNLEK